MRKLALVVVLACSAVGLSAASPPPVDDLVLSQAKCGNDMCAGSKSVRWRFGGNVSVTSPDGGFSVDAEGDVTAPSVTTSGTATIGTSKVDVLDAGVARFNGTVQVTAPFNCAADAVCGTIALTSGTPSTATKTVLAGSTCFCWPVGGTAAIAAGGCAAAVSSTTATFTGPNTVTTTVGYLCYK